MSLMRMIAALVERRGPQGGDRYPFGKPPPRVSEERWRTWHRYAWIVCPGRSKRVCRDPACSVGAECKGMAERGLAGDGTPLKRTHWPPCGARTRKGAACRVKVEAGKRRCRFHSGLSTGPRTEEGRRGSQRRNAGDGRRGERKRPVLREPAPCSIRPRRRPATR
jgi:hypothetical protein